MIIRHSAASVVSVVMLLGLSSCSTGAGVVEATSSAFARPGPTLSAGWPWEWNLPLPAGYEWPELTNWQSYFQEASEDRIQYSALEVFTCSWMDEAVGARQENDRERYDAAIAQLDVADSLSPVLPQHILRAHTIDPARQMQIDTLTPYVQEQCPAFFTPRFVR